MDNASSSTTMSSYSKAVKTYGSIQSRNDDGSIPRFVSTVDDNSKNSDFASLQYPKQGICGRLLANLDPTDWLLANRESNWGFACLVREFIYNPEKPDFNDLQLHSWAVILGAIMGLYTCLWKKLIEAGIEIVWATIPRFLFQLGVFTDQDGAFPLYHYMWIVPMLMGSLLAYIFTVVPTIIPDQNDWIRCVHCRGTQDFEGFWTLFISSTAGMFSGLNLGPELPLVLTGSMVGAWLSKLCAQTILQARVLSLTSASAAVGGFFGFPMAGALFVLELPHRNGIQYYEALGPSVLSSIVAVLVNRWLNKGEVMTGYFEYPPLTESLPSGVFSFALVLGLFGASVGSVYAKSTKQIKTWVHDLFRAPNGYRLLDQKDDESNCSIDDASVTGAFATHREGCTLCYSWLSWAFECLQELVQNVFVISSEGPRAAVSGAIAGALVGVIAMFLPHVAFWGEAQLQNLIDRGLSPLPIFGEDDEATSVMTSYGFCLVDPSGEAGFGSGCALLIALAKIIAIGLSLGTGILGGHFWGPLYVGCAAAHAFTDAVNAVADMFGYGQFLGAYPALVILCVMGSAHVVTFRAHIAIALILTLTVSSFGNSIVAKGDYAVVLPLLVIAVFVAGIVSRKVVFYKNQKGRGDLLIVAEVLCQPGKEGAPLATCYVTEDDSHADDSGSALESVRHSAQSTRTARSRRHLQRTHTFGELTEHEPELLEQSRTRSASSASGSLRTSYERTDSSSSSSSSKSAAAGGDIVGSHGATLAVSSGRAEIDVDKCDRASLFLSANGGFELNV